jgi:hypothetical protein
MSDRSPLLLKRPPQKLITTPNKNQSPTPIDSKAQERAKDYQDRTSSGVAEIMGNQAEYQKELKNIIDLISKISPVIYKNMIDIVVNPFADISKEELEILDAIISGNQSIGLIEAGTGSGKTHGVLKFILENPELFKRTLVGSPTRAMSLDVKQTANGEWQVIISEELMKIKMVIQY